MFDPEKFLQWSKLAQKKYGQDFWSSIFDNTQNAGFLEQISNMMLPQKSFPHADIYQTEQAIIVLIDLPGIKKQDIQIQATDDRLLIKGITPEPSHGNHLLSSERFTGKFERTIQLPKMIDKTGYKASLRDGLLEIHLPLSFEASARTIQIDRDE